MPINVKHFHSFLNKTIQADSTQGIMVSEIKNMYNDIARRENLDSAINNNYLVILLEFYCISKEMEIKIVTSGNLKKLKGVSYTNDLAREFANILTNGLPSNQTSQERLAVLFDNWYKDTL